MIKSQVYRWGPAEVFTTNDWITVLCSFWCCLLFHYWASCCVYVALEIIKLNLPSLFCVISCCVMDVLCCLLCSRLWVRYSIFLLYYIFFTVIPCNSTKTQYLIILVLFLPLLFILALTSKFPQCAINRVLSDLILWYVDEDDEAVIYTMLPLLPFWWFIAIKSLFSHH